MTTPSETTTNLKLVVTSTELNVRFGPGSELQTLETLTLGDQVNYLSKKG